MRKLEINHPEYGKFGKFDDYGIRSLTQEKELGKVVYETYNLPVFEFSTSEGIKLYEVSKEASPEDIQEYASN